MNPSEVLMLIVEASLGLAGFAGVVTAVGQRSVAELIALQRLNLENLLATAARDCFATSLARNPLGSM